MAHNPAAHKLQRFLDCADDRVAEARHLGRNGWIGPQ